MQNKSSTIEVKHSRTENAIPVVNGVHLHSIYNPIKEAQSFIGQYAETIQSKPYVLVMGLGFGYHIDEIVKIASMSHNTFQVYVIEPNKGLVQEYYKVIGDLPNNVKLLSPQSASEIYEDIDFINFLMKKPCIIKHDTSFNMEKNFYINFLKYNAPSKIDEYVHLLDDRLKNYFEHYENNNITLEQHVNDIKVSQNLERSLDFGFIALEAIVEEFKTERGL